MALSKATKVEEFCYLITVFFDLSLDTENANWDLIRDGRNKICAMKILLKNMSKGLGMEGWGS